MTHYKLAFIGFGNVARALARLSSENRIYSNPNTASPSQRLASPQVVTDLQ